MTGKLDLPYYQDRFVKILAQTITWCSRYGSLDDPKGSLRTFKPEYHLLISRDDQVSSLVDQREQRLLADPLRDFEHVTGLDDGRLLIYFPDGDLYDGAAEAETKGFFDVHNRPPEDTWVWFAIDVFRYLDHKGMQAESRDEFLIAWIPPAFLELAQAGIDVNPEQCIGWLDEQDTPFVELLRQLKIISYIR